ncbi:hypothetical protein [Novosphingobium panipatense]|uniref:hypothetical protein n=1 Tax=Novosphingobium panipatense TaxID=428991 RepID=UPI00361D5042
MPPSSTATMTIGRPGFPGVVDGRLNASIPTRLWRKRRLFQHAKPFNGRRTFT